MNEEIRISNQGTGAEATAPASLPVAVAAPQNAARNAPATPWPPDAPSRASSGGAVPEATSGRIVDSFT